MQGLVPSRSALLAAFTVAVMAIVALGTTATSAAEIGKTLDEIVALAKKEPPVRVASVWQKEIIAEISEGFKAKYGLSFTHDRVTGLDTRERILNESIAGVLPYDLVNVSGELRPTYVKAGILIPVEWQQLFPEIDKIHFSPDKHFVATGFSMYGILYNSKQVQAAQAPKTWDDCLAPTWKSKFAVHSRGRPFTALWPDWGRDKSLAYHRQLKANDPVFSTGGTEMIVQIATGEHIMGCGYAYHSYLNVVRKDPDADLKFVVPTDLPFHISEAFAIVKSAKSPNAALLLAAYSAKEGQPAYRHIGRTSPFVDGSQASDMAKAVNAKVIWGGWDFAGDEEVAAAKEIVTVWGFRADSVGQGSD